VGGETGGVAASAVSLGESDSGGWDDDFELGSVVGSAGVDGEAPAPGSVAAEGVPGSWSSATACMVSGLTTSTAETTTAVSE
jgi:hypothetical protein